MNAVGSAVTMTTGGGIQVWLSSRIAGGDELVKANEYKRVQVRDNRKKRDNAIPDPPTRSTIQHIRTCYIYIYIYTRTDWRDFTPRSFEPLRVVSTLNLIR